MINLNWALLKDKNVLSPGKRPKELLFRKKREDPLDGMEDKELAPPPKLERIIGGFTASKGFYPWQVGVRRLVSGDAYSHWCGGTILNRHWILSAAHCFEWVGG